MLKKSAEILLGASIFLNSGIEEQETPVIEDSVQLDSLDEGEVNSAMAGFNLLLLSMLIGLSKRNEKQNLDSVKTTDQLMKRIQLMRSIIQLPDIYVETIKQDPDLFSFWERFKKLSIPLTFIETKKPKEILVEINKIESQLKSKQIRFIVAKQRIEFYWNELLSVMAHPLLPIVDIAYYARLAELHRSGHKKETEILQRFDKALVGISKRVQMTIRHSNRFTQDRNRSYSRVEMVEISELIKNLQPYSDSKYLLKEFRTAVAMERFLDFRKELVTNLNELVRLSEQIPEFTPEEAWNNYTVDEDISSDWLNESGRLIDFFEILNVTPIGLNEFTQSFCSILKKEYRKLANIYHPDKNPDGESMFKIISEGFSVLSEQDRIEIYLKHYAKDQELFPTIKTN